MISRNKLRKVGRMDLAEKVSAQLRGLDALAAESRKANAAYLQSLRDIAKERVHAKRKIEETAKVEAFSKLSSMHDIWINFMYPFIYITQKKQGINIDELPTEFRKLIQDLNKLDKDEIETMRLTDIMGAPCLTRIIRSCMEGRALNDIVNIARVCSPLKDRFPVPKTFSKTLPSIKLKFS
jgi:hypothetical protein